MKDTYELINELTSVADVLQMVGDMHKAEVIREACERLDDLYTIAEYYHGEANKLLKKGGK